MTSTKNRVSTGTPAQEPKAQTLKKGPRQATLDLEFGPSSRSPPSSEALPGKSDQALSAVMHGGLRDLLDTQTSASGSPATSAIPAQDGVAKAAALLTQNTRALRAFEAILEQARELAKSES